MKKIIKKWGKGLGIYFSQEEIKVHHLVEGAVLDLSDVIYWPNKPEGGSVSFKPSPKKDHES